MLSNQRRLTITCSHADKLSDPLCAGLTAVPKPQTQFVQNCAGNSAERTVTNDIPKFAYDVCRCQDGYFWDEDAIQCTACGNNVYFANNEIESSVDSLVLIYDDSQEFTECTRCPETQGHHANAITSIEQCLCEPGYQNVATATDTDEPQRVQCSETGCVTLPTKCEACAAGHEQIFHTITEECSKCPAGKYLSLIHF